MHCNPHHVAYVWQKIDRANTYPPPSRDDAAGPWSAGQNRSSDGSNTVDTILSS